MLNVLSVLLLAACSRVQAMRLPVPARMSQTDVWSTIRDQAAEASSAKPVLRPYFSQAVNSQSSLPAAVASILASKIAAGDNGLSTELLQQELERLLADQTEALERDLLSVVESDPAAPELLTVLCYFKGFLAVSAHRCASALWANKDDPGSRQLALLLQGRASECFGVDIHPGATIGRGVFIDHATGVVIGEQASVGDDCYILHGVTLGATGKKDKKTGRRHPIVGSGCTLGSCASVLGPITVGDGATIGANAIVTKNVEAGATVIETGFMNNRVLGAKKPKA